MLKLINWELASATRRRAVPRRRVGHQGLRLRDGHRGLPPADGGRRAPAATVRRIGRRGAARPPRALHRSLPDMTFGGGTNEIQRDIIGNVGLGLPRVNRVRERETRMDFTTTEAAEDLGGLARTIVESVSTPDRQRNSTSSRPLRPRPVAQADRGRHPVCRRPGVAGRRRVRRPGGGGRTGRARPAGRRACPTWIGRARRGRAGEVRLRAAAAGWAAPGDHGREDARPSRSTARRARDPSGPPPAGDGSRLTGLREPGRLRPRRRRLPGLRRNGLGHHGLPRRRRRPRRDGHRPGPHRRRRVAQLDLHGRSVDAGPGSSAAARSSAGSTTGPSAAAPSSSACSRAR